MSDKTHTEAVAVFHDARTLQSAADALMVAGFDRANLSLLASQDTVEKKLGHVYDSVTELEDDPQVPTQAYAGEDSRTEGMALIASGLFYVGAVTAAGAVVASGGTVAAAIAGALALGGTGGVLGVALARLLGSHHAEALQRHLDRGGLLLWVRTVDTAHESRALEILKANGGEDVHQHELAPRDPGSGKLEVEVYGYLDWLSGVPRPSHKAVGAKVGEASA